MSIMDSVLNVLAMSLTFALVGLSVFLSKKILKLIDFTCEASFGLGGCVYGILVIVGLNPIFAIIFAMLCGYLAGVLTSSLVNYIKLKSVIASMVTAGIVQTILLKIGAVRGLEVGISTSILGKLSPGSNLALAAIVVGAVAYLFFRLLNSEYGLGMRVLGSGRIIGESLGIHANSVLSFGFGIASLLSALAGVLMVQINGDFPVGIGNGCFIFGLSALMIGEKVFPTKGIKMAIISCFMGSIIGQCLIKCVTYSGLYDLGDEYQGVMFALSLVLLILFKRANGEIIKENN